MNVHIDFDEALTLLDNAVKDRGENYIYKRIVPHARCAYFHGEEPGCIVGYVLAQKGLTAEDLTGLTRGGYERMTTGVADLFDDGLIEGSQKTLDLLEMAQQKQDDGWAWGFAVRYAKKSLSVSS